MLIEHECCIQWHIVIGCQYLLQKGHPLEQDEPDGHVPEALRGVSASAMATFKCLVPDSPKTFLSSQIATSRSTAFCTCQISAHIKIYDYCFVLSVLYQQADQAIRRLLSEGFS